LSRSSRNGSAEPALDDLDALLRAHREAAPGRIQRQGRLLRQVADDAAGLLAGMELPQHKVPVEHESRRAQRLEDDGVQPDLAELAHVQRNAQ
jgi:hypothetical protein